MSIKYNYEKVFGDNREKIYTKLCFRVWQQLLVRLVLSFLAY
jgi:hypothetical protein